MGKVRLFAVLIVCVSIMGTVSVHEAQASGWLNNIYNLYIKKKPEGPQPEDTLIAPFAGEDDARGVIMGKRQVPASVWDGTGSLDKPHRTDEELGAWLIRAVAEVFSVDPRTYKDHLDHLSTGMDTGGMEDFKKFMHDNKFLVVLQENDKVLRAFIEDKPSLIKHGALADRYRWLYDVYITLSITERGNVSYDKITDDDLKDNIKIVARVQLGRVNEGGIKGIVIESINIKLRK